MPLASVPVPADGASDAADASTAASAGCFSVGSRAPSCGPLGLGPTCAERRLGPPGGGTRGTPRVLSHSDALGKDGGSDGWARYSELACALSCVRQYYSILGCTLSDIRMQDKCRIALK